MTHREHRVTFYSPGTLFAESTTKPIAEWDPRVAVEMAERITERHGAKPYSFSFSTILVSPPIDDGEGGTMDVPPKQVESSAYYHLGGKVETYAQVVARDDPKEHILRANMRGNGVAAVVVTTNSYKHTQAFEGDDVIVDATGTVVDRASNYSMPEGED